MTSSLDDVRWLTRQEFDRVKHKITVSIDYRVVSYFLITRIFDHFRAPDTNVLRWSTLRDLKEK